MVSGFDQVTFLICLCLYDRFINPPFNGLLFDYVAYSLALSLQMRQFV